MITEISSLQHPWVKKWVKLRLEKSFREEEQLVLLIGEKMIRDLSQKIVFESIIAEEKNVGIRAKEQFLVRPEILRKITGLTSPDRLVAVARLPKPACLEKERILVLDRIQDPGNLGTLLRSALALGWDGVLFTPGTVDPFNDKALRASKGALFTLPFASGEVEDFVQGRTVYLADLEGVSLKEATFKTPLALILSNEGQGASGYCGAQKIMIPMHGDVESLNVATAGAILLYTMGMQ